MLALFYFLCKRSLYIGIIDFFCNKMKLDAPISQIYFVVKLYMFWTVLLSETCRVSWQNKFAKLVHLDGFITKKFVTMHGHMNVKKNTPSCSLRMSPWWPKYVGVFKCQPIGFNLYKCITDLHIKSVLLIWIWKRMTVKVVTLNYSKS
jgi:hypothetical protein